MRLESYYVEESLCSPTRTALLSGRYAYTIGQSEDVIVDGQCCDLPLNLLTIADHFSRGGWNTSAYGKWDARGWRRGARLLLVHAAGSSAFSRRCLPLVIGAPQLTLPRCFRRHFSGFYSAASDYWTHRVGAGYDYHSDFDIDPLVDTVHTTLTVTSAVQAWVAAQIAALSSAKTFAYVAHEAVHAPLEVPASYVNEECLALVPASHPTRQIYCGMVRAVDEPVLNITQTYEKLGILDDTLIVLTTENGGIPTDGGNNYPLRGNKATPFEGGVRGLAFVSGAGLAPSVRGTVSHGFMHVVDWLPTLVGGMAGLDVGASDAHGRSYPTCSQSVVRLDGINLWRMLSLGVPNARKEALLHLQAATFAGSRLLINTTIAGNGAIRVDEGKRKWKLLHGHQVGLDKMTAGVVGTTCTARTGYGSDPGNKSWPRLPWSANESTPWCPFGWTPPPRSDGKAELPRWPADVDCTELPCVIPADSGKQKMQSACLRLGILS